MAPSTIAMGAETPQGQGPPLPSRLDCGRIDIQGKRSLDRGLAPPLTLVTALRPATYGTSGPAGDRTGPSIERFPFIIWQRIRLKRSSSAASARERSGCAGS